MRDWDGWRRVRQKKRAGVSSGTRLRLAPTLSRRRKSGASQPLVMGSPRRNASRVSGSEAWSLSLSLVFLRSFSVVVFIGGFPSKHFSALSLSFLFAFTDCSSGDLLPFGLCYCLFIFVLQMGIFCLLALYLFGLSLLLFRAELLTRGCMCVCVWCSGASETLFFFYFDVVLLYWCRFSAGSTSPRFVGLPLLVLHYYFSLLNALWWW